MSNYGIDDIESLTFVEGVRKRIPMYLGTADTEGIYQALKEVINNSTDEALMGFGNVITICVDEKRNFISVEDKGRGIPFGKRANGENVLCFFTNSLERKSFFHSFKNFFVWNELNVST